MTNVNMDPTEMSIQDPIQGLVLVGRRLHQKNMLAAADGNFSFRLSDDKILITPTGISKGFLKPSDIAIMNLNGDIISGKPSSERLMHLQVYRKCPEAKAVVHAHPLTAIAWSIARPDLQELPSDCLSEVILACGRIPFVPYARPGTQDMGSVLEPFLPHTKAMILRNHGALTWGDSLEEAYLGMERIEHSCQILKAAIELGGLHALPSEEIQYLKELRKQIGNKLL